jgi:probable HAF family extracellular repeat protein
VASDAADVSDDGSIVVGSIFSGSDSEAFRWTEAAGMVGLGTLAGATFSFAYAVSGDGSAVVGASGSSSSQAFLWTAENGMVGLGPSQATYSFATDLSDDGGVVVGAVNDQAFRWSIESGMVRLGFMPGGSTSYPTGVSADGAVIVGWGSGAPEGDGAFVWDSVHGMRLLQTVLTNDYGLNLDGWHLSEARAISADGRTIVGSGVNPSGLVESWLAVLPEPSTALLVGLGLAGIAAWRRRLV